MSESATSGSMKGRLGGAVLVLCGLLVMGLSVALRESGWVIAGAMFGPISLFCGLGLVIEGPEVPVEELSGFMKVMGGLGLVFGFIFVVGMMLV